MNEELTEKFYKDLFASKQTGVIIDEMREGYAKCSFEILPHHKNAYGTVMGGAIFTLADFAVAVASNQGEKVNVSINCNISFVGVAKGNRLIAEANCVKNGRTVSYYEAKITDELGNIVATFSSTDYSKN